MRNIFTIALAATVLFACKKDEPTPVSISGAIQGSGVLIPNEGAFQGGTGTVSFYKQDDKTIANQVFMEVNGVPAGNLLQSITHAAGNVYMVLNGANKVLVANESTMKQEAEITGLNSPRYMLAVSATKAYVTNWGSSDVSIVDLSSNTIKGTVACGSGPERMAFDGKYLYVANVGGFAKDSTVTIIDVATDKVAGSLAAGYNPNSLAIDANGHLWVMCAGVSDWNNPANGIAGKLMKFDLTNNNAVLVDLDFPNGSDHPGDLTMDGTGQNLYWLGNDYFGAVYTMSSTSSSLPTTAVVPGGFYGMGVDPASGEIYTADPKDYQRDGVIYRYTSNGTLVDSANVGLIPNGFVFK